MNELTSYSNPDFGDIRTLTIDGEPWFVGKDVAEILGYKDTSDALKKHVDDEDKGVGDLPTPGGKQKIIIINESGLYSLILSSKLPTAKQFKRWVTSEVLPAIRKTGSYGTSGGYSTTYSAEEVKEIITQEAARMLININLRLGLNDREEFPKKDNSKLGRLSPENRRRADKIIRKGASYEQAAYEIRTVIGIAISASSVRRYAKETGLR